MARNLNAQLPQDWLTTPHQIRQSAYERPEQSILSLFKGEPFGGTSNTLSDTNSSDEER